MLKIMMPVAAALLAFGMAAAPISAAPFAVPSHPGGSSVVEAQTGQQMQGKKAKKKSAAKKPQKKTKKKTSAKKSGASPKKSG